MTQHGTETDFELTTIERLINQGYRHTHGEELNRPHKEVALRDILRDHLMRRYPDLPERSLAEAIARFARPEGVDTLRRNMQFHLDLTKGIELKVDRQDGKAEYRHVYAIDWENPQANEFGVVNQLLVRGQNDRRPDIVIFVNGSAISATLSSSRWPTTRSPRRGPSTTSSSPSGWPRARP